jgi:hypothetical protein
MSNNSWGYPNGWEDHERERREIFIALSPEEKFRWLEMAFGFARDRLPRGDVLTEEEKLLWKKELILINNLN